MSWQGSVYAGNLSRKPVHAISDVVVNKMTFCVRSPGSTMSIVFITFQLVRKFAIFKPEVKKPAAAILAIIWTMMMVQPSFAYFGGKSAYGECSKQVIEKPAFTKEKTTGANCSEKKLIKPSCSKTKGNKSANSSGKDDCTPRGCNPTLGCSSGNFYVHHHYQISLHSRLTQKQNNFVTDDNRVVKSMSECWHPPELVA